jgi:hypothetical protein
MDLITGEPDTASINLIADGVPGAEFLNRICTGL